MSCLAFGRWENPAGIVCWSPTGGGTLVSRVGGGRVSPNWLAEFETSVADRIFSQHAHDGWHFSFDDEIGRFCLRYTGICPQAGISQQLLSPPASGAVVTTAGIVQQQNLPHRQVRITASFANDVINCPIICAASGAVIHRSPTSQNFKLSDVHRLNFFLCELLSFHATVFPLLTADTLAVFFLFPYSKWTSLASSLRAIRRRIARQTSSGGRGASSGVSNDDEEGEDSDEEDSELFEDDTDGHSDSARAAHARKAAIDSICQQLQGNLSHHLPTQCSDLIRQAFNPDWVFPLASVGKWSDIARHLNVIELCQRMAQHGDVQQIWLSQRLTLFSFAALGLRLYVPVTIILLF